MCGNVNYEVARKRNGETSFDEVAVWNLAFVESAIRHGDGDTVELGSFFDGKASSGCVGEAGINGASISVVAILGSSLASIKRVSYSGKTRVASCDGARIGNSGRTVEESSVQCRLTIYGNALIDSAWVGIFEVEGVGLAGTGKD